MKIECFIIILLCGSLNAQNFWQRTSMPPNEVHSLAVKPDGTIFAGASNGMYRSNDNGSSWALMNNGLGFVNKVAINSNGIIYAWADHGVSLSSDNGDHWFNIGLSDIPSFPVAFAATSLGHVFAVTYSNGVYRFDEGESGGWKKINQGLLDSNLRCITIDTKGNIFAGSQDNGVYKSTDNGNTWKITPKPYDFFWVFSLATSSNGTIYAGTYDHGIYYSTNNGDSWLAAANNGLPYKALVQITINSLGHIFTGYDRVYRSTDNGNNWTSINSGLPNGSPNLPFIYSLTNNRDGIIFVATDSPGVYRSTYSTTDVNEIVDGSSSLLLSQIFPNPLTTSATISYSLPIAGQVKIKIFDCLGREIGTLVNEKQEAGSHRTIFNANTFAAGTYLCRLQINDRVESRAISIVK